MEIVENKCTFEFNLNNLKTNQLIETLNKKHISNVKKIVDGIFDILSIEKSELNYNRVSRYIDNKFPLREAYFLDYDTENEIVLFTYSLITTFSDEICCNKFLFKSSFDIEKIINE